MRSEDGETLGAGDERQFIYKGHFEDHVAPDRERERRDQWIKKADRGGLGLRHHLSQEPGVAVGKRHRPR